MERTYVKNIKEKSGTKVTVKGFVQTIRNQGSIAFVMLRDVTGLIQVVFLKSAPDALETVRGLSLESVVSIDGLVKEEKQAPGGYEIQAEAIEVLSRSLPELPIPVVVEKGGEETEVSKRFDWRWIDIRKEEKLKVFKVWTELEKGFREYVAANNYIQVYGPSFMSTASESGAEVFEVNYFDRKAYLAQSPQFYKQMAMASGLERVFMTGPIFRAEPSFTTRHMTEFTGWDIEISYIESHFDVMRELEGMFINGFKKVKETLGSCVDIEVPTPDFPKVSMAEAKKLLAEAGVPSEKAYDVNGEEEKRLCEIIKEKTGHDFVFITDWPHEGRAFYHMRYGENNAFSKSADLLYKGLEVVTCAQREHRSEILEKQALDKGMDMGSLEDYFNFFRYGCPPHGGAGIGPGRIVMKMLDLPSVKEATFLPRDVKRLRP